MSDHLLPLDASKFEKALAGSVSRLSAIPAPIDLLKRPDEIPSTFLPFLAWEVSTDIWDAAWEEWRQRRAARRSIALHRLKGTLPAIKGYLDLLGAILVDVVIPPQGCFALRSRTEEQKREFLNRFAQLRVYLFQIKGPGDVGSPYAGRKAFVGYRFARNSTAALRYGRRATIWDKGSERPVRWGANPQTDASGTILPIEQITVPATARTTQAFVGKVFVGKRRSFAEPLRTQSRILQIEVTRDLGGAGLPIIPSTARGLDVLSYTPERVFGRGTARPGTIFVGRTARRHVTSNRAAVRIFDRFYLFDADRVHAQRRLGAGTFVGHSRARLTPFRAEMRVSYPGRRSRRIAFVDRFVGGFAQQPTGRMRSVAAALRSAKALRDRVVFTTQCHRPLAFEDAPAFDAGLRFGQQVPIRP